MNHTEFSIEGKKVMWVEDDKFLSDVIARKLSNEKCKLLHAADGEQALALLEKEVPDIILLDILLPGLDGFEALSRVKASDKTKNIPVIILSNLGQKADIEKGKKLGADSFLIKATVTLDEIIEELKTVLRTHSQERS
ncbi:MAG: response regulator [Candidatus Taylorbacteria bacterium]|nr:response regulator [Candidatus Taylorbacteria bacterium]